VTSKLRRTLVGVGIALGGAAPGCFGRTDVSDRHSPPDDDDTAGDQRDAGLPDPDGGIDGDSGAPEAEGGALDASSDGAADQFCDLWWPPTKGSAVWGPVPCVDPLDECANLLPPWRCYRMIAPYTCDLQASQEVPLYCIGGEWRCPPGSDPGERCKCWGPLEPGQVCSDGGLVDAGEGTEDGQAANSAR
jgi:hypothetical protein